MSTILGKTYREVITGYQGVAVAKIQYLTGCEQTCLQMPGLKEGKPFDAVYFDDPKLRLVAETADIVLDLGGVNGADFEPPAMRG